MTTHRTTPTPTRSRRKRFVRLLATVAVGLGVVGVNPIVMASPARAIAVSGFGNYCSVGGYASGGWSFVYYTDGEDPCGQILADDPGGTIMRKGLFSPTATNYVVLRCKADQSYVAAFRGTGLDPLDKAFADADAHVRKYCTFTVSALRIPIFNSPFNLATTDYVHINGFDFARGYTLNVHDFGQTGSTAATIVDNRGREKTWSDEHEGHDIGMPRGTVIKAVAAGKVVMARKWDCHCPGSDSPLQQEVAIQHIVTGLNGYSETFVSYYGHLSRIDVTVGQTVVQGKQIGLSGNTGNSSGPHLHLGGFRLSNTAAHRMETLQWLAYPDHNSGAGLYGIDVYGFTAPKGVDPFGWKANLPGGALSVNLWKKGQAPSLGDW